MRQAWTTSTPSTLLVAVAVAFVAPLGSLAAQEQALEVTARALVESLSQGDGAALYRAMDEGGVRVALLGQDFGMLDRRNASAALERFLEGHTVRSATLARASDVGGTPSRGFAEIRWDAVAQGTSEVLRYTLFAGLVESVDGWRVVDFRVLPQLP